MRKAKVSPVANREALTSKQLPTTCETAIASPNALPNPRARRRPDPGRGRRQHHARAPPPSGSRPARWHRPGGRAGPRWKRSREIEAMIGTTMIVRIRLAVKMLAPVVCGAPKIGMKPSVSCRNGSSVPWTKGASTNTPQKPRMTLGIAASISTSGAMIPAHPRGRQQAQVEADRDRDRRSRAASAAKELTAVPKSSEPAPKLTEVRLPGRRGEEVRARTWRSPGRPRAPPGRRSGRSSRRRAGRRGGRPRRGRGRRSGRPAYGTAQNGHGRHPGD